jgi:hypothetical protein
MSMSEHPGDQWIDISCVGEDWEVQFNTEARDSVIATRTWRYRSANIGRFRTDWSYGKPPTGAHS